MRILHVSDCYLPRLGGIEIQVHDLAAHQIEAGDEALILTSTPAGAAASKVAGAPKVAGAAKVAGAPKVVGAAEVAGAAKVEARPIPGRLAAISAGASPGRGEACLLASVEVSFVPGAHSAVPVRRIPFGVSALPSAATRHQVTSILREGAFDVVHLHSSVFSPLAWTVARAATAQAVPAVVTMHSVVPSARVLGLSDLLTGWSRTPLTWTAVSDVAAGPLRTVLGPASVGVLPNGIDPDAWRVPAPRRAGTELTIVSVLRLSRRKRPMALLRMLAGIRAAVPAAVPIRAVLIGDGKQRARLERFLLLSGMDAWVTLTGRLSREQIRPLLAASDVYLAPAELESFGIAALEARCAGLPVIAMAAGGVGEFIREGREGFLVGSDAEMVRVTAALLTSPRLRAMQEHNRCTVPDLAWPRVVGLCREFYHRAGAGLRAGAVAIAAGSGS